MKFLRIIGAVIGIFAASAIARPDDQNSQFAVGIIGAIVGWAIVALIDYILPKNILPPPQAKDDGPLPPA